MPLKDKYLRYRPEITLEIFTLVCNKLIENGINPSLGESIATKYNNFSKTENYLQLNGNRSCFECYKEDYRLNKTTVQEILGYNPFVKDEFVLPEQWCCKITNESRDVFNNWRKTKDSHLHSEIRSNYKYITENGSCNFSVLNTEITFDQFKKYVLKEPIEKPKEIIPEYVECIAKMAAFDLGKIYKTEAHPKGSYRVLCKDGGGQIIRGYEDKFKPSNKEAYDAQNQPKSIEGKGFIVVLENKLISHTGAVITKGNIYKAINKQSFEDDNGSYIYVLESEINLKWFATKSEAEEFAKTLVEPVKEEVKQPREQAVHCTTQEEWDFVCEKLHRRSYCKFREIGDSIFISNPECSYFKDNNPSGIGFISFQEWCDLNGYKMESNQEFKVGEYIILENAGGWSYSSCNNGCLGLITKIGDYIPGFLKNCTYGVTGKILNSNNNDKTFKDIPVGIYEGKVIIRHATPEEINQHLISIGQIPAGEPIPWNMSVVREDMIRNGIKLQNAYFNPNIEASRKTDWTVKIHYEPKLILSIDDDELPMVNIIKTKKVNLLNND